MSLITTLSSMSQLVNNIGPGFVQAGKMAQQAFAQLKKYFNDKVIQPIRDFIDNLSWEGIKAGATDVWDAIQLFVGEKIAEIKANIGTMWDGYREKIAVLWKNVKDKAIEKIIGISEFIKENLTFSAIGEKAANAFQTIRQIITAEMSEAWGKISSKFNFRTLIGDFNWKELLPDWNWKDIIPQNLSEFFALDNVTTVFTSLTSTFTAALQPIKNTINLLIDAVNDILSFDFPLGIGSISSLTGLSDIPRLAKGGIVSKPTLALIGEDGPEAVVPLTQRNNPSGAGMGGGTYNITVNASGITDRTDKRNLAREIGNMIQQELARNLGGTTMRGRY